MLRDDPFMLNGLHSGVISNDSNVYVFPITWKPDEWLITANLTGGYILVYPQNGRGALSFKLDRGHIRVPLNTDAIAVETVGATGFFDVHPVLNRKEFGVTLSTTP